MTPMAFLGFSHRFCSIRHGFVKYVTDYPKEIQCAQGLLVYYGLKNSEMAVTTVLFLERHGGDGYLISKYYQKA